jgi:hypothetical protein
MNENIGLSGSPAGLVRRRANGPGKGRSFVSNVNLLRHLCGLRLQEQHHTEVVGKMPKTHMEKSEMSSTVEFCQYALRERIAPPSVGSVKSRILYAARKTGWGYNRTRDIWYADARVSIKAEQLIHLEALSGLEFARQELRKNEQAIDRATALLGGEDTHLVRAMVTALFSALGLSHSSRA